MNHCKDLILGKAFCIFIFFHFPDSRLSVLKRFPFLFLLSHVSVNRDMSNFLPAKRGFKMACLYINSLVKHVGELRVLLLAEFSFDSGALSRAFGSSRKTQKRVARVICFLVIRSRSILIYYLGNTLPPLTEIFEILIEKFSK